MGTAPLQLSEETQPHRYQRDASERNARTVFDGYESRHTGDLRPADVPVRRDRRRHRKSQNRR